MKERLTTFSLFAKGLLLGFLVFGCKDEGFDDASKRNEDWAYWIDESTGKGSWIRVANKTTVDNGIYYLFFYNGKIFEKGKLKDKKNIDTIYRYDLKEELIYYTVFAKDSVFNFFLKDGAYIEYYQDGTVFQKGTVTAHVFKDDWVRYYKNGNIEWIQDFQNGKGKKSRYFENGDPMEITNWEDNWQDGLSTFYFGNGQIETQSNWAKGKQHGMTKWWYDDGNIKWTGYFKEGILDGPYKEWNNKGQILGEGVYSNGAFNGNVFNYHDNGIIEMRGHSEASKPHGLWEKFDEKGQLVESRHFKNGIWVNKSTSFIDKISYKNGIIRTC